MQRWSSGDSQVYIGTGVRVEGSLRRDGTRPAGYETEIPRRRSRGCVSEDPQNGGF